MSRKPFIVSISAVSGGGKTTIASLLSEKLPHSKALFFDDYQIDGPDDFSEWVQRGANHNEWKLSPLIQDLTTMLENESTRLEYIVLDYPFAYLNDEMKEYIDLAIFIDTPLDIAMARRILRADADACSMDEIRSDLYAYLAGGRSAYENMLRTIKPNSDLIVDGTLPIHAIVEQLFEQIKKNSNG